MLKSGEGNQASSIVSVAIRTSFGSLIRIPWSAIPRGMQGSDLYMNVAPYPPYGPTREHALVLPAEHIVARLEERMTVLETQVKALQDTVDNWEQWYYQWNPLFRLLHWMFGFMQHRN